jgi:hypothetical protein
LPVAALFDFHYGKAGATNRFIWSTIPCARSENEITLPVVAGIFGGGDSNTFMQGIRRHLESSSLPTDQVVCLHPGHSRRERESGVTYQSAAGAPLLVMELAGRRT